MITYDLESDGLYEEATKIHCIVIKCDSEIHRFYNLADISIEPQPLDHDLNREEILKVFKSGSGVIICHNQLNFDIWMLKKFFDIDLIEEFGWDRLVDTYVWSQALHPDRKLPRNCATTITLSNGRSKKIGPHGLESYGYRVSVKKPGIEDWSTFNQEMISRCTEDVIINEKTYEYLLKER